MSEKTTQNLVEGLPDAEVNSMPVLEESGSGIPRVQTILPKKTGEDINFFAGIGFTLGFSALFFLNTSGIPAGLGLILSAMGLWQIKRKGEPGRAFAIWGIVLALLSLVWLGLQYLGVVTSSGMLFNFIKGLLGFKT